jgi:hypothetical protein
VNSISPKVGSVMARLASTEEQASKQYSPFVMGMISANDLSSAVAGAADL